MREHVKNVLASLQPANLGVQALAFKWETQEC